ncbi:MAG: hypothetical protein WC682_05095 [Parcubacteria group bacterium]|jgi:hypothetical protein
MSDRASKILKDIEQKKIKPKSRWLFLAEDYLLWAFFVLTTLVGALAVSVIIFIWADNDWDIYKYLEKDFFIYMLWSLPYFWFIVLVILSIIAYFNYIHTRKGYLLNPYGVVAIGLLGSIFLGWIFFVSGMGKSVDEILDDNVVYYNGSDKNKIFFWTNSNRGLLAGEIIELKDGSSLLIMDFNKERWQVMGDDTIWEKSATHKIGERIKIIGKIEKEGVFKAREIRSWNNAFTNR